MIRINFLRLISLLLYFGSIFVNAGELDSQRARFNYMIHCQGCHLPDASGSASANVPRIKDYAGNFLKIEGGREFLVRVPGSANSAIDDEQLAELLNWIILEFSGDSLPDNFKLYTGEEVAGLRTEPLAEVMITRAELVKKISLLE